MQDSVSVTPNLCTVHLTKTKKFLLIWREGCLSLSFFLHQQGEQIPQAKMLVLVAAIPTPCLWFTLTGMTVAVICLVSHLLLVATHKLGVHQVSYQLSHGSGSFPNQLWMQQRCMWKGLRQPSYKISQFYTVPLQACTFWIHTLKATSCITWNWWGEEGRCGFGNPVGAVNEPLVKKYLQKTALQQGTSADG